MFSGLKRSCMYGKTEYWYTLTTDRMTMEIFRPDGISIRVDTGKLYLEIERRKGIIWVDKLEINQATLKMMYRVGLEMEQYVKFEPA